MLLDKQIIQKDIFSVLTVLSFRANNVLIDLIMWVICKILVVNPFTFVNLLIASNNYLFLTVQTMGAPDTRRDIIMEHTV